MNKNVIIINRNVKCLKKTIRAVILKNIAPEE